MAKDFIVRVNRPYNTGFPGCGGPGSFGVLLISSPHYSLGAPLEISENFFDYEIGIPRSMDRIPTGQRVVDKKTEWHEIRNLHYRLQMELY
jgi:hypothetical protein